MQAHAHFERCQLWQGPAVAVVAAAHAGQRQLTVQALAEGVLRIDFQAPAACADVADGERHADRNAVLPCSNLAHGFAAMGEDKQSIATRRGPNIGIVSAYNDTISSHQPFGAYPPQMKVWAREVGATAQVAGGKSGTTPSGVFSAQPTTLTVAASDKKITGTISIVENVNGTPTVRATLHELPSMRARRVLQDNAAEL